MSRFNPAGRPRVRGPVPGHGRAGRRPARTADRRGQLGHGRRLGHRHRRGGRHQPDGGTHGRRRQPAVPRQLHQVRRRLRPARAVNATRKLIQEDRVHLVICCTTTPASLAVNKVIEEERVPNLSLAAAASVIEPADAHRYTFKTPLTDRLMIDHTVDYMVKQGWKQVAFMGLEDSYGEGGWVEFKQIATRRAWRSSPPSARAATPTSRRRRCACRRRNPTRSISTPSRPRPRWQPRRCAASATRVRCCMAPARPRRPSWRSARRRSKARWSAPRPCPCIASCPTTIRSSPASPRSCRPMTASTAPARPTCSRPRPTTRCRSRCWPIARWWPPARPPT